MPITSARDREREFDALYDVERTAMHAYFVGRTGDPEQALDLLQELFIRLWRSLETVLALPAERRRFWLYRVGRNLVVDHVRALRVRQDAQARLDVLPDSESSEARVVRAEKVRQVDAAIACLPEELRTVLALHVLGERTSREIGEMLGRPPGTVRYQLAQARKLLAAELAVDAD
jgi:RNA polymerase sigma-70 factor (ECF subfamily)